MTIAQILRELPAGRRSDAIWLLSSLLKCSKTEVLLNSRDELNSADAKTWAKWWRRRASGEPLQYISGAAPFYGREFAVDKRVLIPRPETERLVEIALDILKGIPGARLLDIGTGSGVIALTMKAERPDLEVTATDISLPALKVAKANAEGLGLRGPGLFLEKHDLFSKKLRNNRWDLIISNPPYLDFRKDRITADVKRWEPRMALEPATSKRIISFNERAAWCGERILASCALASPLPRFTALELSLRVAAQLEKRWRKNAIVERAWRMADLAGRKRFLLVAWKKSLSEK